MSVGACFDEGQRQQVEPPVGRGCCLVGKDSIYSCLPVDAFRFTKNLAYFTYVLYL